ncbi:unnamed protein product, partial [Notodromas monacha]
MKETPAEDLLDMELEFLVVILQRNDGGGSLPPGGIHASLVNVSVLLLSLSSPDESSLKYEVEFLLHLFWMDTRLAHNETTGHKYLNGIHHQQHVWLPDIYFLKHGDFKHPTEPVHIALRIYGNGTIHYTA